MTVGASSAMRDAARMAANAAKADTKRRSGLWTLLPAPVGWMLFFYLAPLAILLAHAFWSVDYLTIDHHFTLVNFRTFIHSSLYPKVFIRTVRMATLVTLTDIALAFPLAFFIAKKATRNREFMLVLVVFPLWSSYLVRVFAWKTMLGTNGILNSFLIWTGVIKTPVSVLLYSNWAIFIAFVHIWLPFMILPLYAVLERIPDNLLEAASDLGSGGLTTFRRVILPLAMPGILAGSLAVFSLTMGDYITPTLLGGPGDQMMARIIADQFGVANNWPLGAMLIIPVLITISVLLIVTNRFGASERTGG